MPVVYIDMESVSFWSGPFERRMYEGDFHEEDMPSPTKVDVS